MVWFWTYLWAKRCAVTGLLVGLFLLLAGFKRQEAVILLQRAVRFCLECMGIG